MLAEECTATFGENAHGALWRLYPMFFFQSPLLSLGLASSSLDTVLFELTKLKMILSPNVNKI